MIEHPETLGLGAPAGVSILFMAINFFHPYGQRPSTGDERGRLHLFRDEQTHHHETIPKAFHLRTYSVLSRHIVLSFLDP